MNQYVKNLHEIEDYMLSIDQDSITLVEPNVGKIDVASHYLKGDIECVDYLYDNMPIEAFIGGLEWSVKKYLHRWRYKENPVKDLRKARDYLSVLIDTMEGKEPKFKEWLDE